MHAIHRRLYMILVRSVSYTSSLPASKACFSLSAAVWRVQPSNRPVAPARLSTLALSVSRARWAAGLGQGGNRKAARSQPRASRGNGGECWPTSSHAAPLKHVLNTAPDSTRVPAGRASMTAAGDMRLRTGVVSTAQDRQKGT